MNPLDHLVPAAPPQHTRDARPQRHSDGSAFADMMSDIEHTPGERAPQERVEAPERRTGEPQHDHDRRSGPAHPDRTEHERIEPSHSESGREDRIATPPRPDGPTDHVVERDHPQPRDSSSGTQPEAPRSMPTAESSVIDRPRFFGHVPQPFAAASHVEPAASATAVSLPIVTAGATAVIDHPVGEPAPPDVLAAAPTTLVPTVAAVITTTTTTANGVAAAASATAPAAVGVVTASATSPLAAITHDQSDIDAPPVRPAEQIAPAPRSDAIASPAAGAEVQAVAGALAATDTTSPAAISNVAAPAVRSTAAASSTTPAAPMSTTAASPQGDDTIVLDPQRLAAASSDIDPANAGALADPGTRPESAASRAAIAATAAPLAAERGGSVPTPASTVAAPATSTQQVVDTTSTAAAHVEAEPIADGDPATPPSDRPAGPVSHGDRHARASSSTATTVSSADTAAPAPAPADGAAGPTASAPAERVLRPTASTDRPAASEDVARPDARPAEAAPRAGDAAAPARTAAPVNRAAEQLAWRDLFERIDRQRLATDGTLELEITTERFGLLRVEAAEGRDGVHLSLRGDGASQRELADLADELRQQFGRNGGGLADVDVSDGGDRTAGGGSAEIDGAADTVVEHDELAPGPAAGIDADGAETLSGLDLRL